MRPGCAMVQAAEQAFQLARRASALSSLDDDQLEILVRSGEMTALQKDDVLYDVGSSPGKLYIVERGEIVIERPADEGRSNVLASFIEGESFGELDIMDTAPVSTRAFADKDSRVLVIPGGDAGMSDLFERHPDIGATLLHTSLRIVAGRIRSANKLISEKRPWVEELREQVFVDKLTGLYNATYLSEEAERSLDDNVNAVLVVKPDNFKIINDTYGHDVGDDVLRMFAQTLKNGCTDSDIAARLKSDIFVLIFSGTDEPESSSRAESILRAIRKMDLSKTVKPGFRLTASIGIVHIAGTGTDLGDAVARADTLMLGVRGRGGDAADVGSRYG